MLFYYKRASEVNRRLNLTARLRDDLQNIIDILASMGREEEQQLYKQALADLEQIL